MAYCQRCCRHFVDDSALAQHKRDSGNHYLCGDCNIDFKTYAKLTQHYSKSAVHHFCEWCQELFDTAYELNEHDEDVHYECDFCDTFLDEESDLREHCRDEHVYCLDCRRTFQTMNALASHLRTAAAHQARTIPCPGRKCKKLFVTGAGLLLHLESGACPSRMTREQINRIAVEYDSNRVITNPARLIRGPDGFSVPDTIVTSIATELSWNGRQYECFLCHREFKTLDRLDQHFDSPAHADKIYRCPQGEWKGCGVEFKTLSGLCQHVESETCGIRRFNQPVQDVIGQLASGLKRLAF